MATKKRGPASGDGAEIERLAREAAAAKLERVMAANAAKLADKAERTRAKVRQAEARTAQQVARIEQLADGMEAIAVWLRDEPGARRPRWSRDELAATAVRLVDEEGLDALSMRRLAAVLGAGTMTLYHYVKTKDELMALVVDAVLGEVLLDDDQAGNPDWQTVMRAIATRSRDSLLRHPWVFDVTEEPPLGPNAVRHFDQSIGALAGLDVDLATKLDIIFTVDEYVFGYCLQRRNDLADDATSDSAAMVAYTQRLIATGGYPNLEALVAEHGAADLFELVQGHAADADRFDRNLHRLLNGIAAEIEA